MTRTHLGVTPYHLAAARANNYTLLRDSAGRVSLVANGRDFDPGITIPNGGWNAPLGDVARWVAFLTGYVPEGGVPAALCDGDPGRATPNGGWNAPRADVARWVG